MLEEAKRESERVIREAREQQARWFPTRKSPQAGRAGRRRNRRRRPCPRARSVSVPRDYADEILNTLEVNLQKFTAAVQRGRDRLAGRDEPSTKSRNKIYQSGRSAPALPKPAPPFESRGLVGWGLYLRYSATMTA